LTPGDVETYRYTVNGVEYAAQVTPLGASATPEPGTLALGGGIVVCITATLLRRRRCRPSGCR
jgi:hypothetical protein